MDRIERYKNAQVVKKAKLRLHRKKLLSSLMKSADQFLRGKGITDASELRRAREKVMKLYAPLVEAELMKKAAREARRRAQVRR